jgi:hypothetical protein
MVVVEVVDELLGAHRIGRRAHAGGQHPPHVAVAAGVRSGWDGGYRQ